MAKRGGQRKYSEKIGREICIRLAAGKTLRSICRSLKIAESTVRLWVVDDAGPGFAAQYARSRDCGLDVMADEIIEIADKSRKGVKVEQKQIGRQCSACSKELRWRSRWEHSADGSELCDGAKAEKLVEDKVVTSDMIERSRLQVDARKWYLSKLAPKRYGDKPLPDSGDDRLNEVLDLAKNGPAKPSNPAA